MKRIFAVIFIVIFILSTACWQKKKPLVGGDKDRHGCIGPAGYTWCEAKNKCIRPWEEKCE